MRNETKKGIARRFTGKLGIRKLIAVLCEQDVVRGDEELARMLARTGVLTEFKPGSVIIRQDATDSDLYFIIAGAVAIIINGREINRRTPGQHFGEMALIETTARRSATVQATEPTTVLKLSADAFETIAARKPLIWRRLALTLSVRLRDRGKFHQPPHSEPVVFIGSSTEALPIAEAINRSLRRRGVVTNLWTEGIFQASETTIEDLWAATKETDLAVIVLANDDVRISRGKKGVVPRDNAVFELGLFMGALGRRRVLMVTPVRSDLKIPTDLLSVKSLRYDDSKAVSPGVVASKAAAEIFKRINECGAK